MADSKSQAWRGTSAAQRDTGSTPSEVHSKDSRIRVVLVGNQTMVRAGLAHVLATHARLTVVSEGLVSEAVHQVEVHQPDVLVLVGDNDPGGGIHVVPAVQAASSRTMVLLLRSSSDVDADARALAAGVRGVLLLEQPPALLLKAV